MISLKSNFEDGSAGEDHVLVLGAEGGVAFPIPIPNPVGLEGKEEGSSS
jgi:hypothetical protein